MLKLLSTFSDTLSTLVLKKQASFSIQCVLSSQSSMAYCFFDFVVSPSSSLGFDCPKGTGAKILVQGTVRMISQRGARKIYRADY